MRLPKFKDQEFDTNILTSSFSLKIRSLTLNPAVQVVLVGKNLSTNAGDTRDLGLIPGSGRSPGEGNGNPLQYSCLENSTNSGAWWATVHGGHKELDTAEREHTQLSDEALVNWN